MKKKLAFVLSSGGSRGALQVGALFALYQAGYHPDLITGSSIGAANGAFLAVHGYSLTSLRSLVTIWEKTANQDLLPTNLWWQTMRAFFTRTKGFSQQKIKEFAIENGLTPDLRFRDLKDIAFYPVAADLNAGCPVVMGLDPDELVLDSVLASMTLPPWLAPMQRNGRYLVDGGAVSHLPIEAAIQQGASEIVALDLLDPNENSEMMKNDLGDFVLKLDKTVENRQTQLELALAEAKGIPVWRISLTWPKLAPFWDFRQSAYQIECGYEIVQEALARLPEKDRLRWWERGEVKEISEGLLKVFD